MRVLCAVFAVVVLSFSQNPVSAQCDEILKHGIFNEETIRTNSALRSSFNEFIYDMDFHTHDQAINAGLSVGVVVYGVPLQIGGTFDDKTREEWKREHQEYKNSARSSSEKYELIRRTVSADITKAWLDCKKLEGSRVFGALAEDIGQDVALVTVVWNPIDGDPGKRPVVMSSNVSGGKRNSDNLPVVFDKQQELLRTNISIINRDHGKPLVAVIHTSRGDVVAVLTAVVDKPEIQEFTASPTSIKEGGTSLLEWKVSKGDKVVISNGIGEVASTGSFSVSPKKTTAYVLSAKSVGGVVERTANVEVKTIPEIVTHVEVEFYSTSDDKDPEDTLKVSLLADGLEVAKYEGSKGQRWSNDSGPYPCRYVTLNPIFGEVPDWAVNRGNDASPRTFVLKKPVLPGIGARGRLTVSKTGSDQGWTYRVEVFGITNKGHRLRYDNNWNHRFDGDHQSTGWDFTW